MCNDQVFLRQSVNSQNSHSTTVNDKGVDSAVAYSFFVLFTQFFLLHIEEIDNSPLPVHAHEREEEPTPQSAVGGHKDEGTMDIVMGGHNVGGKEILYNNMCTAMCSIFASRTFTQVMFVYAFICLHIEECICSIWGIVLDC